MRGVSVIKTLQNIIYRHIHLSEGDTPATLVSKNQLEGLLW